MSLDLQLQKLWYGNSPAAWLLLPLSWCFRLVVAVRRCCFAVGLLKSYRLSQPVIVVGNLTVGGTGKTPLVIWLSNALAAQGKQVAVITRGYGGKVSHWPQQVLAHSDPLLVGDEAVLLAQQTKAIVMAGPDRVASAQQAVTAGADVIISDDGLQHYRLQRDCELVVVDASRYFGNGYLLPAGPLREPVARLKQADLVLLNQRIGSQSLSLNVPTVSYRVELDQLRGISSNRIRTLAELQGQKVHVVTAIGNPESFINALREYGLEVVPHVFPDHAALGRADIEFADDLPVLMTEKDAVKCHAIAGPQHWAVGAQVVLSDPARTQLLNCVQQAMQQRYSATR
ncbi:MAG: tetraacyldisaccharide 4'-kinase [Steroidobacteraceae bacterium]